MTEECEFARCDPQTVVAQRCTFHGIGTAPHEYAQYLRIKIERHSEWRRDSILGEPPRQPRSNFADRLDQCNDQAIAFAGVHPAMEASARTHVPQDCGKAGFRILKVMQYTDAIH